MPTITQNIAKAFAACIIENRIEDLRALLHPEGEFNVQNEELSTVVVDSSHFVAWMKYRMMNETVHTIDYDQCVGCSIGATIILFNGGTFPREIQDSSDKSKTALMLDVKDGYIHKIVFCGSFLKTENNYCFENTAAEIKKLMDQGMSFEEAYFRVMGEDE